MYGRSYSYLPHNAQWDVFKGDYWGTMRTRGYSHARQSAGRTGYGIGSALGGVAATYLVGFAAGAWTTGKVGAAVGSLITPGVGTVVGAIAGALVGGAIAVAGSIIGGYAGEQAFKSWTDIRKNVFGSFAGIGNEIPFKTPFVNTRMAGTMRQASMQSMMNSAAQYRSILEREAGYMHR